MNREENIGNINRVVPVNDKIVHLEKVAARNAHDFADDGLALAGRRCRQTIPSVRRSEVLLRRCNALVRNHKDELDYQQEWPAERLDLAPIAATN